ncbi:MAG: caspase family protein [Geminicoccaceae bacterium]
MNDRSNYWSASILGVPIALKDRQLNSMNSWKPNVGHWLLFMIFMSCCIMTDARATANYFAKSYALVIGIDDYAHPDEWPTLSYGTKDALAMADFLSAQGYEVTRLLGEEATRRNILRTISEEMAPKLKGRDRVMVFFSGHGDTREVGWRDYGYIIPYDGNRHFPSWISMAELREMSAQMQKARHQLFIFDSCYGGSIGQKAGRVQMAAGPRYIEKVSSSRARQFLTAGGKNEQVPAEGPFSYSYFTGYLLEALKGDADHDEDGYVTMSELSSYMLTAASTWGNTPRFGTLREHALGEFWFRVPGASETDGSLFDMRKLSGAFKGRAGRTTPQLLNYPQDHQADDLTVIKGFGPKAEKALYDNGIYHYWQIADWTHADLEWIRGEMPRGVKGKITVCSIQQAQKLLGRSPDALPDCDLDHLKSHPTIN